jgi:hypothetical protein
MRSLTAAVAMALLLAPGAALLADTPPSDAPVAAVWAPESLRFTFLGFTAKYSCDGLQDKIRRALLKLGARPDLKVNWTGCAGGISRPTPFPGVSAKMFVLRPASEQEVAAGHTVAAHWRTVDVNAGRDPLDAAGDCELTEQIKQRILPKFTTRNVDYRSTCIPNQLTVGGTQLKAEVLIADDAGPKAPAAK